MNLLRRAKLILEPGSINAQAPLRSLVLITCVGLLVSYGSYAYSAASIPAIASLQDHDHDRELQREHEHRDEDSHDQHDGRVFRARGSDGSQYTDSFFAEKDGRHDGDNEQEFLNHLRELLNRNEAGSVSHQELAQRLRELADHLESSVDQVRSPRNVRRNVKVRPNVGLLLRVEPKLSPDWRRLGLDLAPDVEHKRVVVDRQRNQLVEAMIEFDEPKGKPWRQLDGTEHQRPTMEARISRPDKSLWVQELRRRGGDDFDREERDMRFGPANNAADRELGELLRELKNEVQQLRQEVNRLKSDRDLSPRGAVRGTLQRRRNSGGQDEPQPRFSNSGREKSDKGGQIELRRRQSDNREHNGESDQRQTWFGWSKRRPSEKQDVVYEWAEEEPAHTAEDDEVIELRLIEDRQREKK